MSDNPAGLRPGNQFREVGIFTDRGFGMQPPFGRAFDATCCFSSCFCLRVCSLRRFSNAVLLDWPILSDPFFARLDRHRLSSLGGSGLQSALTARSVHYEKEEGGPEHVPRRFYQRLPPRPPPP